MIKKMNREEYSVMLEDFKWLRIKTEYTENDISKINEMGNKYIGKRGITSGCVSCGDDIRSFKFELIGFMSCRQQQVEEGLYIFPEEIKKEDNILKDREKEIMDYVEDEGTNEGANEAANEAANEGADDIEFENVVDVEPTENSFDFEKTLKQIEEFENIEPTENSFDYKKEEPPTRKTNANKKRTKK